MTFNHASAPDPASQPRRRQRPPRAAAWPSLFPLCLALAVAAAAIPPTGTQRQAFRPGGIVHVQVPVGDIHIASTQGNQIVLRYHVHPGHNGWFSSGNSLDRIRLRFEVHGDDALISFEDDNAHHNNSIDVELDVPAQVTLRANTGVGDIVIQDVAGDKDLSTGVGDIRVNLDAHPSYHSVEAGTGVGDVQGGPFGQSSGFVGKSLSYSGNGRYRLRAHTGVGDVKLLKP